MADGLGVRLRKRQRAKPVKDVAGVIPTLTNSPLSLKYLTCPASVYLAAITCIHPKSRKGGQNFTFKSGRSVLKSGLILRYQVLNSNH